MQGVSEMEVLQSPPNFHEAVRHTIQFLIDLLDTAEADGEDREPEYDGCEAEDDLPLPTFNSPGTDEDAEPGGEDDYCLADD